MAPQELPQLHQFHLDCHSFPLTTDVSSIRGNRPGTRYALLRRNVFPNERYLSVAAYGTDTACSNRKSYALAGKLGISSRSTETSPA
jgi:hypothetical protein